MKIRAIVSLWLIFVAGQVLAQAYPSKPVRFVVPASPGGASDLIARMLATPLAETFGQPFVVENRVTSGGIVGTQQVAESPADGHTLLVTFDTFAINPFVFKNLKWDPLRDFTPVMQICRYPQVLLVHPSLGVFPPISLPKREYLERAKTIWEELGLPKLKPEAPWYGYTLGEWPDELERAAEAAVKGDYFETGKLLSERRRNDVAMNTEVRDLKKS